MQNIDTIISARWIVPVDGKQSMLEGHAVAIDQGGIVALAPAVEIQQQYAANETVELGSHVLIPGLINAHTHAAMTLLRGYADDLPLMEWLQEHIWPAEGQWVNREFMQIGTDLAIAEMIRGGTTCFNDMYFFPDIVAERAQHAGIRACIGMIVIDFPTVWANDADEYISKGLDVRDSLRHSNLLTTAFAPHAPYTVADPALERIRTLADELDCQIHMHVHETAFEIEQSNAQFGMRPLERLDQLGLLTSRLSAVHMTQLLPAEIESLADRGVHVVHCPQSNLKLASGMCPVHSLLESGINVAIGTDGAASNNDLDMLDEARCASLLAKGVSQNPAAMNMHQALYNATLAGARALGLDDITGSITIGKRADLTAIDLSNVATQPVYNPVSALLYSASRDQVSDVWIQGQRVMNSGQLMTLDEAGVLHRAMHLGAQIAVNRKLA